MKVRSLIFAIALVSATARADESRLRLIDAPGRDLLQTHCLTCHSVDYVLLNAGIPDRKGWEASVNKMRKIMGAPLSDADALAIVDYLTAQYGKLP